MVVNVLSVSAGIDKCLERSPEKLIAAYFDTASTFAGILFDNLGENDPQRLTPDDLLAVSLLGVRFSPRAVRYLFNEANAELISTYLRLLDVEKPIWSVAESLLNGPATALWNLLVAGPGIGKVIAGKLLARKRPHLIPIVDKVVIAMIGAESTKDGIWRAIRGAILDTDRRARVESLRSTPGAEGASVLRLLDVVLWMNGSQSKDAKVVRLEAGLAV